MHNPTTDLREIAAQIEAWRAAHGLSKSALCKRYGHLGSSKTYGRIINPEDTLDEQIDVPRQLDNYRAAWELIRSELGDGHDSELYGDLQHVREALQSAINATQETGNNRLVLITGERGSGKSGFLDILSTDKRTANITFVVEATEAWREKPNNLLGALLMEVGCFERKPTDDDEEARGRDPMDRLPSGTDGRLRKLVERLDGRRLILAIDEAHHIGPAGFNVLKSIINQTRAVIVMCAIPVLLGRIMKASYAEAAQLFENRIYEIIKFHGPDKGECLDFLKRRGVKFTTPKEAEACASKVIEGAATYALWNYVGRVARKARELGGNPYTGASFVDVIVAVKKRITMGN